MENEAATIIDLFGGTTSLARQLEAPPSTVHSWRTGGIPASRMAHIRLLAEAQDIELPQRSVMENGAKSLAHVTGVTAPNSAPSAGLSDEVSSGERAA